MLSRMNALGLLTVVAIALLLLVGLMGSPACADGAAGQIPDPPQPSPPDDGSGDGSSTTFTEVTVTLLFLII